MKNEKNQELKKNNLILDEFKLELHAGIW